MIQKIEQIEQTEDIDKRYVFDLVYEYYIDQEIFLERIKHFYPNYVPPLLERRRKRDE